MTTTTATGDCTTCGGRARVAHITTAGPAQLIERDDMDTYTLQARALTQRGDTVGLGTRFGVLESELEETRQAVADEAKANAGSQRFLGVNLYQYREAETVSPADVPHGHHAAHFRVVWCDVPEMAEWQARQDQQEAVAGAAALSTPTRTPSSGLSRADLSVLAYGAGPLRLHDADDPEARVSDDLELCRADNNFGDVLVLVQRLARRLCELER